MKSEPVIAIVGATGLVGQEMLSIIDQIDFPFCEIRLFGSDNSQHEVLEVGGDDISVDCLSEESFDGVDIALFAIRADLAKKWVPLAVEQGALVIDNSSCFRMDQQVPLLVPEVNADRLGADNKIVANPNCSAIPLCMALDPIAKEFGLERVVLSTFQSVSGAGKQALEELWLQSVAIFNQTEIPKEQFNHQIAFNCIPHIDTMLESGYSKEENKIINETRKILDLPELSISATAVRVPVFHSHSASVNIQTTKDFKLEQIVNLLNQAEGIEVFPAYDIYPMQITAAGSDSVQVGRIRKDESLERALDMWIVSDNLRKGAALNALQIAQLALRKFA